MSHKNLLLFVKKTNQIFDDEIYLFDYLHYGSLDLDRALKNRFFLHFHEILTLLQKTNK